MTEQTGDARKTFGELWDECVAEHADSTFLVFAHPGARPTTWTYREFDDIVARTAARLSGDGVREGDCVHLALRNCPGFVAIWLALARLGAWMVPADPAAAPGDLRRQAQRTHPRVGICGDSRAGTYLEGMSGLIPTIIELTETAADVLPDGVLLTDSRVPKSTAVGPADRLAVMFTSGTTGTPKGVVLTQANYVSAARVMAELSAVDTEHRWYVTLPIFHANAQYYCFASAIAVGASIALTAAFTASGWTAGARALQVTHASLFAAPIRMILARTSSEQEPLDLEHVWFAQNLSANHYTDFAQLVGTRPRQLYGMTETLAVACCDMEKPYRHNVIGRPPRGRQLRVRVPGTGQDAAVGQAGELLIRGTPGADLFACYLDDAAATDRAFDPLEAGDVWFATGDLVASDEAGDLRFVGRVDDIIKVAGENVSLAEIEGQLTSAPGIFEAAVIARADPIRDVVPVAYVVPKDPANPPTASELSDWARRQLSPAARPVEWHFIDELPRTSVGKVRRFRIGADTASPGDTTAAKPHLPV
ncbi:class I adenylate-forming enzyme family protein [Mycobacterium sp. NPDC003449]